MHRQNLVIRRFGSMSFGLGRFEHGVWIDHAGDDRPALASDREALDLFHLWFSCCDPAVAPPAAIAIAGQVRSEVAAER